MFSFRTLTGSRDGPHLLITAGVHGDEFEPMWAARRLIQELDPRGLRGRVTIIPCVNEPAFRRGARTGDDDLDLARTCPGRSDGSPTERIAHALSEQIRGADYYIDLHTGGVRLQVYPLVGYMLHPDEEVLTVQRRMAQAFGFPLIWGTDPDLPGRSLSVARAAGVPAIYAEYLGGGLCRQRGVEMLAEGCRRVLVELGLSDEPLEPAPAPALIQEDPRPDSGHMQIQHPADCDGFFEPVVVLGERVAEGQVLGTITDPLGERRSTVCAAHAGYVIVLRSFAPVTAGECLGVVLESEQRSDTLFS